MESSPAGNVLSRRTAGGVFKNRSVSKGIAVGRFTYPVTLINIKNVRIKNVRVN